VLDNFQFVLELVGAAEYDIERLRIYNAKNLHGRTKDGPLLHDLESSYQELIAKLHLVLSALESRTSKSA